MSMSALERRHRRWGWACLGLFALSGLLLEAAHGFKLAAFVDHETRRSMWRLAHAHGALLGLVHLAYAAELVRREVTGERAAGERAAGEQRAGERAAGERGVSLGLRLAAVCMPLGFVLGGVWFYDGDPGLGIALVPVGGAGLIYACLRLASGMRP